MASKANHGASRVRLFLLCLKDKLMNAETSKNDGAGSDALTSHTAWSGAVVCCDAAEARLMRRDGRLCITSTKLRTQLDWMFIQGGNDAMPEAVQAVGRLGGISSADNYDQWSLWDHLKKAGIDHTPLRSALEALPVIETPFKDPENVTDTGRKIWECAGTTVLVAFNTSQLVQVGDTYAAFDCYRPHGRMDDPFKPESGRVCIISSDELRLLRIEGIEDIEIVLTYELPEETAGMVVARWPSPLRALCAERPGLRVGIAPALCLPRYGEPFFLGLTRGMGYESAHFSDGRWLGLWQHIIIKNPFRQS